MFLDNVTRKQAFATHLSISITIFLVMLVLILFYWYPSFFLTLDGGVRGIATIFFVDVVLGPGLTLLFFKPGKPSLKLDMSIIVLLQIAALVWGVAKVYEDRSVAAVFYLGKFNCIGATNGSEIAPDIQSGESHWQKLAFLRRPDTMSEYGDMLTQAIKAGSSEIYYFGERVRPIDDESIERIRTYELDIEKLRAENSQGASTLERYIEEYPGYMKRYGMYPLSCRFGDSVAVLDFEDREIIKTLDVLGAKSMLRAETSIPLR